MARDKTFSAIKDVFGDDLSDGAPREVKSDELTVKSEKNTKKTKAKRKTKPRASNKPIIDFSKNKSESVTKTFRIKSEIDDVLTGIVTKSNGKKRRGSKGFLSQLVNNAVIKELVELGALDESYLDEIVPYDE